MGELLNCLVQGSAFVVGFQQAKEEGHSGRVCSGQQAEGSDSILTAYCLPPTAYPLLCRRFPAGERRGS
ncbi:MAG: hypothetical protein KME27_31485 [Lyngbya sp. HA4199-MV5]|nr:hypothetical protein [Lyngbya sp. HA4199-MV5]